MLGNMFNQLSSWSFVTRPQFLSLRGFRSGPIAIGRAGQEGSLPGLVGGAGITENLVRMTTRDESGSGREVRLCTAKEMLPQKFSSPLVSELSKVTGATEQGQGDRLPVREEMMAKYSNLSLESHNISLTATSGDEIIFDPIMSKKKKKNPFMLDEEGDAQTEETQHSETKEVEPVPTEDKDVEADEEDTEEGGKDLKIEGDAQAPAEPEDDLDIRLGNKKKEKNVRFPDEDEILEKDEALEDEDSKKRRWHFIQLGLLGPGSERDCTDEELLNRVFNVVREKNPDMVAGEKRNSVMKPPQVVRVGTKKTSFVTVNYYIVCSNILHFYWQSWVQVAL
ncbi:LOW QUALITY PROTEIN: hypothetical protein U0070_019261 [Myodes glareolus]|uniref:Uncharacterized protein n=1 Tax=Myodes glareolus TaxID=447135 RepID=A0AAW0IWG9_MYOGA